MVYKSGLPVYSRRMRDSVLIKKKNKKICNVEMWLCDVNSVQSESWWGRFTIDLAGLFL